MLCLQTYTKNTDQRKDVVHELILNKSHTGHCHYLGH